MSSAKKVRKYIREYKVRDMVAMARNGKTIPARCDQDFHGRLVVITGATSGIGYHTARTFAARGANLICVNRNPEKSQALSDEITSEFGCSCETIIADMSRLSDARRVGGALAARAGPIDVLIHNAGLFLTRRTTTAEGFETVFVVNYLSSFVINYLVADKLVSQESARILLVNSEGHRFAAWGLDLDDMNWDRRRYSGLKSYGSA